MKFFISILSILLSICFNHNIEINSDFNKLIQCDICQEMFAIDFNIDQFIKDKNRMNKLRIKLMNNFPDKFTEINNILSIDNLQFMTQEISMQYFFKGAENQIDEKNASQMKTCKMKQVGNDKLCDTMKLNICESLLSFTSGFCSDAPKVPEAINMPISNPHILQQLQNQINPINQMMKDINSGQPIPENISLLELSPSYIDNNFDSKPKSHWTPPKPVLLDNFEKSMGDQLKEISYLTT